jgi:hypothetical protein
MNRTARVWGDLATMRRGITSASSATSTSTPDSIATATWLFRLGGVGLFLATAGVAASAADDLVLYRIHEQYALPASTKTLTGVWLHPASLP